MQRIPSVLQHSLSLRPVKISASLHDYWLKLLRHAVVYEYGILFSKNTGIKPAAIIYHGHLFSSLLYHPLYLPNIIPRIEIEKTWEDCKWKKLKMWYWLFVLLMLQQQYGYLVIQMLMSHLDTHTNSDPSIKASIIEVLYESVLISAGGSIGKPNQLNQDISVYNRKINENI